MIYIHIEQAYYKDEADQFNYELSRIVEEAISLLKDGFTEANDFNGNDAWRTTEAFCGRML